MNVADNSVVSAKKFKCQFQIGNYGIRFRVRHRSYEISV